MGSSVAVGAAVAVAVGEGSGVAAGPAEAVGPVVGVSLGAKEAEAAAEATGVADGLVTGATVTVQAAMNPAASSSNPRGSKRIELAGLISMNSLLLRVVSDSARMRLIVDSSASPTCTVDDILAVGDPTRVQANPCVRWDFQ